MKLLKTLIKVLVCIVILLLAVFLIGRYAWKLGGFSYCETAGIEQINVEENQVQIRGFYPGSFPQGFIGYYAKQVDDTLYVGFKFSGVFGIFENGDFDIVIPTEGTVSQVVMRTAELGHPIWPEDENKTSLATDLSSEKADLSSEKTDLTSSKAEEISLPTVYKQIIDRYRTALEDNYDGQQLTDFGLNLMVKDITPNKIGYAVKDLDGNGISELIIGTVSGDDFYGKLILLLYTINKDGDAVQIFSSTDRNRYYYAGDNRFANLGSSSASDSFVTTLKLEDEEMVDMTFTTKPTDYVQMTLTPIVK